MYKQGDIILIPVPFTDLTASKKRPVLIVSNDVYNAEHQDMIVVAITSNLAQNGIPISNSALLSGQLPKPSVIRADRIYTLHQGIVIKPIGRLSTSVQEAVKKEIDQLLELP